MEIQKNDKQLAQIIEEHHIADFFEDIKTYQPGLKLIRFSKNTYLYSRPEHRKYAYFLVSGKLSVYATAENGSQMLVRYILETAGKRDVSEEEEIICFKENLRRTAELLDISYRHLHRILGEFVDSGLLRRIESGYQVLEPAILKEISGEKLHFE